jgi:hypothetical protein
MRSFLRIIIAVNFIIIIVIIVIVIVIIIIGIIVVSIIIIIVIIFIIFIIVIIIIIVIFFSLLLLLVLFLFLFLFLLLCSLQTAVSFNPQIIMATCSMEIIDFASMVGFMTNCFSCIVLIIAGIVIAVILADVKFSSLFV